MPEGRSPSINSTTDTSTESQGSNQQSVLDKIESNIEKHLSDNLEEKISKTIETKLTHQLLKDDQPKQSLATNDQQSSPSTETNSTTESDQKENVDHGDADTGTIAANTDGNQSLAESQKGKKMPVEFDDYQAQIDSNKIEKDLENKIEQSISTKIEQKIENDLLQKLEQKIQGNLDQKISKTFEQSLKKIDATVSNVANSFNNLTNIIVKRNQETTTSDQASNQTLKQGENANSTAQVSVAAVASGAQNPQD